LAIFPVAYCGLKIITSLRSVSLIFSECTNCSDKSTVEPSKAPDVHSLKIRETERSEVMIFSPQKATGKIANPK
jgi:hypothetical protein